MMMVLVERHKGDTPNKAILNGIREIEIRAQALQLSIVEMKSRCDEVTNNGVYIATIQAYLDKA